jgi:hypothetical protein
VYAIAFFEHHHLLGLDVVWAARWVHLIDQDSSQNFCKHCELEGSHSVLDAK